MRGQPSSAHRGLTLVESVIATAVLAVAITGIFSALAAGQAHAGASADELAATVAAEDMIDRILHDCARRGVDPLVWDGHREFPGNLRTEDGGSLSGPTSRVGRQVRVRIEDRSLDQGPDIEGRLVEVTTIDRTKRTLGVLRRWVARSEGRVD